MKDLEDFQRTNGRNLTADVNDKLNWYINRRKEQSYEFASEDDVRRELNRSIQGSSDLSLVLEFAMDTIITACVTTITRRHSEFERYKLLAPLLKLDYNQKQEWAGKCSTVLGDPFHATDSSCQTMRAQLEKSLYPKEQISGTDVENSMSSASDN